MGIGEGTSPCRHKSKFTTYRRWRLAILLFLIVSVVWPLRRLCSGATNYQDYVYNHMKPYFGAERLHGNTLWSHQTHETVHRDFNFGQPCANFPNTDGILLVMKTGATEAYEKLPTHFVTHMQCLPDHLIFSDVEAQIGKYHIYDALDQVNETAQIFPEFRLYDAIQNCPISQADCTKGSGVGGWVLDKYKFIHMAVKTWQMRPNMEWYVFAEADSYIVWSNLAHWLRNLQDHRGDQYFGSMAMLKGTQFAHGGSGYVLSGSLLKKIVNDIPNLTAKYDDLATRECCGDYLLALAVAEVGGKFKESWPQFNGEKPTTIAYGPRQWCEPLFTMHHMNAEEISMIWQFEQTKKKEKHLQIKDLYETFVAPKLIPRRQDWNNLSEDRCLIAPDGDPRAERSVIETAHSVQPESQSPFERDAHRSADDCSLVCEAYGLVISDEEHAAAKTFEERKKLIQKKYASGSRDKNWNGLRQCFQWSYRNGVCCTGASFRLGSPQRDGGWESGWFMEGIENWIEAKGTCSRVEWRDPRDVVGIPLAQPTN